MSLRTWALKPSEFKGVSRAGLLLLSARCALRAEPWVPPDAEAEWREALMFVLQGAFADPTDLKAASTHARTISDLGACACNRLASTDEPLGRCLNYATQTVAAAVEATTLALGPALKKAVILAAKLSASIPGVLAHAGRVHAAAGEDAVDVACIATWDAIRSDVSLFKSASSALELSEDRLAALRCLAPLWPAGIPGWAIR
jgi:hypothetical protein